MCIGPTLLMKGIIWIFYLKITLKEVDILEQAASQYFPFDNIFFCFAIRYRVLILDLMALKWFLLFILPQIFNFYQISYQIVLLFILAVTLTFFYAGLVYIKSTQATSVSFAVLTQQARTFLL